MINQFLKTPIKESPWIKMHSKEDVDNYIEYVGSVGSSIVDQLDDGNVRNSGSFLSGVQMDAERYNFVACGVML